MSSKWKHRISLLFFLMIVSAVAVVAQTQDDVWTNVDKSQLRQSGIDSPRLPHAYETFRLNKSALEKLLRRVPEEFTGGNAVILDLPMPDGSFSRFQIEHSLVVEPSLLKNYPELGATYRGQGIDDPTATAR